ncbi:TPA: hypothetical protein ACJX8E_004192, partial [Pseudomonas aeruginosa]
MFAYVMLGSINTDASRTFYGPSMKLLGGSLNVAASGAHVLPVSPGCFSAEPCGRPYSEMPACLVVVFPVSSRTQVEEVYALAMKLGAIDEGAPGASGCQANTLYACYPRVPVGNKLCVCHFERAPAGRSAA